MYEELFEAWKKEKENTELQAVPRDFYTNLADYMKKMKEESRMLDKKTTRARLMHRESENTKKLIKDQVIQVERKEKPKKVLVRFVQEIPAIIGSDMNMYGPFRAEDIATLPPENAKILIKQGIAMEVEAKT